MLSFRSVVYTPARYSSSGIDMAKLSAGQKRHKKDLRRKKRHPVSKCPTQSKRNEFPFLDELFLLGSEPQKLSAVIWDFASPLLDVENQSAEEVRGAIGLAITCWNIGLLNKEEQKKTTEPILESARGVFPETSYYNEFEQNVKMLIKTKQTVYGFDDRHIISFDLSYGDNEYYLQVLSSFTLPDSPEFSVNSPG